MADFRDRARDLVQATGADRERVRHLVTQGRWREAEPDPKRSGDYARRRMQVVAPPGAEAFTGDVLEALAASFLPEGAQARRAVAYVEVNLPHQSRTASGFLVSPDLFITNSHVIADADEARAAQLIFDRELDENGRARPTNSFLLDPDRLALFSPAEELDYALVAIGPRQAGSASLAELGFCFLSNRPDKHRVGMNVNIIQHPANQLKLAALRKNILQYRGDTTLLYETDTDHGSSGSPVFNDDWELVALHHYGEPFLERQDEAGKPLPTNINEGVRISAIYNHLASRLDSLALGPRALLAAALAYDKARPAMPSGGPALTAPHRSAEALDAPATPRPALAAALQEPAMPPANPGPVGRPPVAPAPIAGEIRLTVPLEITIRLGSALPAPPVVPVPPPLAAPPRQLSRGAEAVRIDGDYSNRGGFDAGFIPGLAVPLPTLGARLRNQVAPLRPEQPDATEGELKYTHFSIKVSQPRRMAIFTATNIDGDTYLAVDRGTGEARPDAAEGDTWFRDSRISPSYLLEQPFYSEWSHLFDRGHLTRRSDPTWGDKAEAERANADTFHFTNCSPQHFRFNQTTPFWQGAERYVLENGLLASGSRKRICVFQGPVFDDKTDLWAGDVQIPSFFFKLVVWQGEQAPRAVALVVEQKSLLSEERRALGQPREVAKVNVQHWRVAVATVEQRTGLDFGEVVRQADTFGQDGQPRPGAEALAVVPITAMRDLLPG